MTLKEVYDYGVYFLSCNGVDEAEFKSLCLVCHLDGIKNSDFHTHCEDEIIHRRFADLLWRVKSGEPLQYIIGKWDFYKSEFFVGRGVLIPRPETEELTDLAVKAVREQGECVVYDLCAGSGCIGASIAAECPESTVYLIEKSGDAMPYLLKNTRELKNASVICGDIATDFELPRADFIVTNPPYIPTSLIDNLQREVLYEPLMALDGGDDGLDFYRLINKIWSNKLKRGGMLFAEIGENQGGDIAGILSSFINIKIIKDMYSNDRIVTAEKE